MNSRILPSFAEIDKAEVTERARVAFIMKKGWYFAPFSVASGATSPKILQDHSFPIPHNPIPLSSFVQMRPVFEEIYPKMSSRLRLITISA